MIDSNMQPNMQHAETFLTRLAEGVEHFTFQTFDDRKDRLSRELTEECLYAQRLVELTERCVVGNLTTLGKADK